MFGLTEEYRKQMQKITQNFLLDGMEEVLTLIRQTKDEKLRVSLIKETLREAIYHDGLDTQEVRKVLLKDEEHLLEEVLKEGPGRE